MNKEKINQPSHIAFQVTEGTEGKNYWNRVGAMWATKDGGFSLKVDAMPIDGEIALRPRELLEKMRGERKNQPTQSDPELGPRAE
jgi:hypothetical protein